MVPIQPVLDYLAKAEETAVRLLTLNNHTRHRGRLPDSAVLFHIRKIGETLREKCVSSLRRRRAICHGSGACARGRAQLR